MKTVALEVDGKTIRLNGKVVTKDQLPRWAKKYIPK